jgi:taspase (threonine aspartase 1)
MLAMAQTWPLTAQLSAMLPLLTILVEAVLVVPSLVRLETAPFVNLLYMLTWSAPGIRNPISLAKLILDLSKKPLSLRRVPPNNLVGEGAKSFAEEHGMMTYSNEYLVSKSARSRFQRWQRDLQRAGEKGGDKRLRSDSVLAEGASPLFDTVSLPREVSLPVQQDHAAAILAGTWNEGQPDSPYPGGSAHEILADGGAEASSNNIEVSGERPPEEQSRPEVTGDSTGISTSSAFQEKIPAEEANLTAPAAMTPGLPGREDLDQISRISGDVTALERERSQKQSDGVHNSLDYSVLNHAPHGTKRPRSPVDEGRFTEQPSMAYGDPFDSRVAGDDIITDTVGAIAIDEKGQIAAGSSSGGIGMKHRGRLGPAALVGIGTAVIPRAEDDEEAVTVAAVTSGTGEHMATTMASQQCAERIYRGTRRGPGGSEIPEDDEDVIMDSFITQDFMNHVGVKHSNTAGAIGVMVVKKTRSGCYFYFAHNTDSFALASMGGSDKMPVCTMSRLSNGAKIAQGGRKVRVD